MLSSYHSHTRWCNHACGEIEDYVTEAVRNRLETFTICDHTPDDNHPFGPRCSWNDYPNYLKDVNRVENKYGDQIELLRGFEAEYYPDMMTVYQDMKYHDDIRVWILGQHESADHNKDYYHMNDIDRDTISYTDDVIAGINTGFYQILAHPDLILINYLQPSKLYFECMNRIFEACEKHNVIIEINANGIRGGKNYPNKQTFIMSKAYKLQYIVSSDAHAPNQLVDQSVARAEEFAKNLGLLVLDKIEL